MRGRWRDPLKKAVLLALTGLEAIPEPREWARPKTAGLKGIVNRLGKKSLRGNGLAMRSRRMLAQIAGILHMGKDPEITAGNVRAIISRFRNCSKAKADGEMRLLSAGGSL